MLYYVKIGPHEGVDYSEGQDCTGHVQLRSIQCIYCLFHFNGRVNFYYERNICNGCYHCMLYEEASPRKLFRVVKTDKGTFRVVSSYFLNEIEKFLMENDLNERFGWLYKHTAAAAASKIKLDCHTESNSNLSN